MINAFDQFDITPASIPSGNAFDQFDAPKATSGADNSLGSMQARRASSEQAAEKEIADANQAKPWYQRAGEGLETGAKRGLLGLAEIPGKVKSILPDILQDKNAAFAQDGPILNREDAANVAKGYNLNTEGNGIVGSVAEVAGDPLNYIAPEFKALKGANVLSRATNRALQGAGAGYFQPETTTDPDQAESEREKNAGMSSVGFVMAPVVAKALGKSASLLGKGVEGTTGIPVNDALKGMIDGLNNKIQAPRIYSLAQKIGLPVADITANGATAAEKHTLLKTALQNKLDEISQGISPDSYDPEATHTAISQGYHKLKGLINEAYDQAGQAAPEQQVQVPQVASTLENTINSLRARNPLPGSSEASALNELQGVQRRFGLNIDRNPATGAPVYPALSAKDLLGLRRMLNEQYIGNAFRNTGQGIHEQFTGTVRNALDQIGQDNPEFGKALLKADALQAAKGDAYDSNKVLQRFWDANDYNDWKAVNRVDENGIPSPRAKPQISDLGREKANTMVEGVKTPEEVDALARAIGYDDPAKALAFRAAKFREMVSDAGLENTLDPDKLRLMQNVVKDPKSLELLSNIQGFNEELGQRGIKDILKDPEGANGRLSNAARAIWDLVHGRKSYAATNALKAVTGVKTAGQKALEQISGDLSRGQTYQGAQALGQSLRNAPSNLYQGAMDALRGVGAKTPQPGMSYPGPSLGEPPAYPQLSGPEPKPPTSPLSPFSLPNGRPTLPALPASRTSPLLPAPKVNPNEPLVSYPSGQVGNAALLPQSSGMEGTPVQVAASNSVRDIIPGARGKQPEPPLKQLPPPTYSGRMVQQADGSLRPETLRELNDAMANMPPAAKPTLQLPAPKYTNRILGAKEGLERETTTAGADPVKTKTAYMSAKPIPKSAQQFRPGRQVPSPEQAKINLDAAPVVKLSGNELGEHADIRGLRKAAEDVLWDMRKTAIDHPDLGEISINQRGMKKIISAGANPDKLKMIPKLPEIVKESTLMSTTPNYGPNKDIAKYHWLEGKVELNGKIHRVGSQIAEYRDGHKVYNFNADLDTPNIKGPLAERGIKPRTNDPLDEPSRSDDSLNKIVAQNDKNVKFKRGGAVDRTHDVPYLAGKDEDTGGIDIDKRVPKTIPNNGKSLDVARPLAVHENTERKHMAKDMPYAKAHKLATIAEKVWITTHGYNWAQYEASMRGYLRCTEHEHANNPPKGLYKGPYLATKARALTMAAKNHRRSA